MLAGVCLTNLDILGKMFKYRRRRNVKENSQTRVTFDGREYYRTALSCVQQLTGDPMNRKSAADFVALSALRAQLDPSSCPELGQWIDLSPISDISEQIDVYSPFDVLGSFLPCQ
jgi:SET domain-containing protein